jgi:hypothetical protein
MIVVERAGMEEGAAHQRRSRVVGGEDHRRFQEGEAAVVHWWSSPSSLVVADSPEAAATCCRLEDPSLEASFPWEPFDSDFALPIGDKIFDNIVYTLLCVANLEQGT